MIAVPSLKKKILFVSWASVSLLLLDRVRYVPVFLYLDTVLCQTFSRSPDISEPVCREKSASFLEKALSYSEEEAEEEEAEEEEEEEWDTDLEIESMDCLRWPKLRNIELDPGRPKSLQFLFNWVTLGPSVSLRPSYITRLLWGKYSDHYGSHFELLI